MNATLALIRDTFREAFARRIFWGFFGCCTALLLFLIFILRVDVVQGALATISIFGNSLPSTNVENLVQQTQSVIAMVLYFAGMALSVFASAGLVSAVFEPGRIELLLSKPVSRTHLLLGRYAGNVLVVAANILYLVVGSWVIFGIKTGVWGLGFLISSLCGRHHGDFRHHDPDAHSGAEKHPRTPAEFGMVPRRGPCSLLHAPQDFRHQHHHPAPHPQSARRELDAGLEHRPVRDRGPRPWPLAI